VASSRRDSRRTNLGGQRQGVEKQEEARWRASEHAYRDKERDERSSRGGPQPGRVRHVSGRWGEGGS
jgi:hypothetical protein